MTHFTDWELEQLNSLKFDSTAQPCFDPLRYCLRWLDEVPKNFGGESYERLLDLAIVRSFIHSGKSRENWWVISPTTYFAEVWDEAITRAPNWPGFNRIELNAVDRAYFENESAKPLEDHL